MRYQQLLPIIAKAKPKVIVEVGTWNGLRAIEMCTEALKHQDSVHYTGFDLFEHASDETDARELNVKAHHSFKDAHARLRTFKNDNPGFEFALYPGDTRESLRDVSLTPDLAFIDGGHSIETIRSDYEALKGAKVIVFDDFYEGGPDTGKFGCNSLIGELKDTVILPQKDPVKGGGTVQMALTPKSAFPGKVNLVIKTQNCAKDEQIQANIRYCAPKIGRWISECRVHAHRAVIASGGPSLTSYIEEIRARQEAGHLVFCVKHAHDPLIEAGIVPYGCFLLDPRDHVRDFIENPHPGVRYFVASMCHPSTLDRLIERDAKIIGYNAHVGAGEEKVLPEFGSHIMIGGGSTSATRGISLLYALGFRMFDLYGYDSCYYEPQDTSVRTKTGHQKYFEVEVSGKKFWSDSELMAQAQDFDKLMQQDTNIEIDAHGDGMIPHIWSIRRKVFSEFSDVVNV